MSEETGSPKVVFVGRLHPAEQAHMVQMSYPFHFSEPNIIEGMPDVEGSLLLKIEDGAFVFNVPPEMINNSGDTGMYKIKNTVDQILGQILDSVNFVTDARLEGEAEKCLVDGWGLVNFSSKGLGLDVVEEFKYKNNVQNYVYRMLQIRNGLHLRHALADYRRAGKYRGETAMHCFRSIESIRQHFAPGSDNRKQSWERMREALNLEDDWLRQFEDYAKAQRHGQLVALRGVEVKQILETTWLTIKRFTDYLLGENVDQLPMLTPADVTNP